jgi:hypothetical protein
MASWHVVTLKPHLGYGEMIDNKRRIYQQDIARNEMRLCCAYMGKELVGQLPMHISYLATDLIARGIVTLLPPYQRQEDRIRSPF